YEPDLLTHDDGPGAPMEDATHAESGYRDDADGPSPNERSRADNGGQRGKGTLSPKQRKRRRWRIVRRTLYALFAVFVVLPAVAFTLTYLVVDVPSPESVAEKHSHAVPYDHAAGNALRKVAPDAGG